MSKSNKSYSNIRNKLQQRKFENRLRSLQPVSYETAKKAAAIDGSDYLNFCSNDYLGLSSHPDIINNSIEYTSLYGASSGSSRLVSGSMDIHHQLEEKIAGLYGAEDALLFGNGFIANATILPALAGRGDLVFADKLCHNSILQGVLSGRAEFRRFRHNDSDHLEALLKKHYDDKQRECWVVTESLFSMDGDFAPLDDIAAVCKKHDAYLMVDDAHAFGVWGGQGLGLTAGRNDVDISLGTMGKAGGSYGAFVHCSNLIKEYLVNYCSGVIYTTSPPPSLIGAMEAAFNLIPGMDSERDQLKKNIDYLSDGLEKLGFDTGGSRSQIVPVILNDEKRALQAASHLKEGHIFVQAIRPPTVDASRLRITLSSLHTQDDINKFLEAMKYV